MLRTQGIWWIMVTCLIITGQFVSDADAISTSNDQSDAVMDDVTNNDQTDAVMDDVTTSIPSVTDNVTTADGLRSSIPDVTDSVTTADGLRYVPENAIFLMFPENTRYNKILKLLITSKTDTNVHVFSETPSFEKDVNMKAGGIRENVPADAQLDRGIVERKAIEIISPQNISVYGVSHYDCCSTDGFYALPYKALGTLYKTVSYHAPQSSFVSVLAVHDNTQVNVTLNATGPVDWQGRKIESGATIQLIMNKLTTVEVLHHHDLTGTTVKSDQPVAVMSGNTCSYVLGATCNHLVEYLPPVSNFGYTFVIPTIKTASRMIVRVVPSESNCTLTFYDYRGPHIFNINATFEIKLLAATLYLMKCSTPCMVVQYAIFTQRHPAPFMTLVPAVEQYDNSYTFMTPDVEDFNHYITVVTLNKHADDIMLNGIPVTRLKYVEKHLLNADDDFWVSLSVFIDSGVHTIRHVNVHTGFGGIGYGFKPYDAYAFPLGMKFQPIN